MNTRTTRLNLSFIASLTLATLSLRCAAVEPVAHAAPLDAFGGWTDVKGRATGWFHLESFNGRTLLVTPYSKLVAAIQDATAAIRQAVRTAARP